MLDRINALLESEDAQILFENNQELITEAVEVASQFNGVLKSFVLEHPQEFLAENLEETYKNIRIFSEIATAQYLYEVSNFYGSNTVDPIQEQEEKINDYL